MYWLINSKEIKMYIYVKDNVPEGYALASTACKMLNISRERLRQLRNKGLLIFVRFRKSYFYKIKSIDERKPKIGRPKKY